MDVPPWTAEHERPSAAKGFGPIREDHLKPLYAFVWLKNAHTCHVQGWLNQIGASNLHRNTLDVKFQ
jgi:hypothetical protein